MQQHVRILKTPSEGQLTKKEYMYCLCHLNENVKHKLIKSEKVKSAFAPEEMVMEVDQEGTWGTFWDDSSIPRKGSEFHICVPLF